MLHCLEKIDDLGWLHSDITPANTNGQQRLVCLFNRLWVLPKIPQENSRVHVVNFPNNPLRGTLKYMSLNQLNMERSSRKDNLELLAYNLIHIATGKLPWSSQKKKSPKERFAEKNATLVDDLCAGLPVVYKNILLYSRILRFAETPNYDHWISEFEQIK